MKVGIISPFFFGFHTDIANELERQGNEVFLYNERFSDGKIAKVSLRFFPLFVKNKVDRYYANMLKDIEDKNLQKIIVIKGEAVPIWFLKLLREREINVVYYLYDSVKNNAFMLEKSFYFDRVYTFDNHDAEAYNWRLLPLYIRSYSIQGSTIEPLENRYNKNVFFIGTLHGDRFALAKKFISDNQNLLDNINLKIYFYSPSRVITVKNILQYGFYHKDYIIIRHRPFSKKELDVIMEKSKAVLDFHHPNQTGLTARTWEAIEHGKKIITTNSMIKTYDIYDPELFALIDRENMKIDLEWLLNSYSISVERLEKYTLKEFVRILMEGD